MTQPNQPTPASHCEVPPTKKTSSHTPPAHAHTGAAPTDYVIAVMFCVFLALVYFGVI